MIKRFLIFKIDFNKTAQIQHEALLVAETRKAKFRDDIRTVKSTQLLEFDRNAQEVKGKMGCWKDHAEQAITTTVLKLESRVNKVSDPLFLTTAVDSAVESIL